MNPYGYSYKFNLDFFILSLVSLISLPNLIINIGDKFTTFKELDIAYYNKQIIQNKNSFLLRASLYCEIKDNNIILRLIVKIEEIIENLSIKLGYFYDLYKEKNLIEISKMKNIQFIFFFDNVQLTNIKEKTIKDFIIQNKVSHKFTILKAYLKLYRN